MGFWFKALLLGNAVGIIVLLSVAHILFEVWVLGEHAVVRLGLFSVKLCQS